MKSIRLYITGMTILVFAGGLFISCTKTFDEKIALQSNFNNSTIVQVFMAMVNANRNYVYVDGKQVTGSLMISGSLFPSIGYGFSVPGGLRGFLIRDTLPATFQVPLPFATDMQVNKNYTIFVYDTITSPKQKTVETSIVVPADTSVRIRFANFIYNPSAVPAIDVFSFNRNVIIFTNVAVTDVTNFISYPSRLLTDTLYIRETGSTTNIVKLAIGGLTPKRSYTVVYRGSHRGTRAASLFANR